MLRAVRYAIERFKAGRALRQREEHLRLLNDQLPCLFWTTDLQMRFTSFSGSSPTHPALEPGEIEGHALLDVFDIDDPTSPILEAHRDAALGHSKTFDMHWRDEVFHVHIEPFRQRDGSIVGTIGVALDITDQKLIDLELRVARQVQEGLRPRQSPDLDGFDIAGASFSAAAAGGDYFDYFRFSDDSTGIVVCDVAGHGLGPAMMMCNTRAYLRALAQNHNDPIAILSMVNAFLIGDTHEERLVALFLAKVIAETRTLEYANAGHRGYLLRHDRPPELLRPTGIPLNVLDPYQPEPAEPIRLEPGDIVLLYTDGIIDCWSEDGTQFGVARMIELVQRHSHLPAREVVDELFAQLRDFSKGGKGEDDMTAVILKVEELKGLKS